MTRYFRLGYLVPRLVLLVVLFCVIELGSGWALRHAVVSGGEQAIGARVELGDSTVSLVNARATMKDLRIADPKRPMQNLLEAERITLDFEADSLLRKRAIAEHGVVSGLRFGTPRETSGALDPAEESASGVAAPAWIGGADQAISEAAGRWLDGLEKQLKVEATDLESVRLAEELAEAWPNRFDSLTKQAKALQRDAKELRTNLTEAKKNPLRNAAYLKEAPQRIQQLQQRLAALNRELTALPAEAAADKQRIAQARTRDEQRLRDRLQVNQLDHQSLTTQLLGEPVTESIRELIGWVRWTREMIPSTRAERATTPRDRGVDVHFVGVRRRPNLLIRQLELSGAARLAGRPVELSGLVSDYTNAPELHAEPMRIELRTDGALPMEVRAMVHRGRGAPIDEFLIDCPAFGLPGVELGKSSQLAMKMAPSTASLSVNLRVEGQRLSGHVEMVQDRVTLTSTVGDNASPLIRRLGAAAAHQAASVAQPTTRVTLSGSLDQPQLAIWSSLGSTVAASLKEGALGVARTEALNGLVRADRQVTDRLASIDGLVAEATQRLTAEIGAPSQEIQQLAGGWLGDQLGESGFSIEQVGKRLGPAGALFK
ncbi:hypothetical protein MalM25_07500 [Planctomycetes bacterium MalM25]|nr:hypothetical protein MalM25_07500 [Planctomycetes bacterium MalM25]